MRCTLLLLVALLVAIIGFERVFAYEPNTSWLAAELARADLAAMREGLYNAIERAKILQAEVAAGGAQAGVAYDSRERRTARARQSAAVLKAMPVAGYIPWGRTHCNSTNNPQNYYTKSNHQSYVTVAYYVNEVLGGILLNGSRYLIKDINYNDGADCTIMKILYQHMVDVDGAQFLFAPVNPDCSVLSKFAESRGIPFGNGGDYSLLILRITPNATTPYDDEPWAQGVGYDDLQWTYNGMNDITQGGASCAEAMTNPKYIDQSRVKSGAPPAKVRTAVFGSNQAEVPYLSATQKAQLIARGVTEVHPEQNWDLKEISARKCAYLGPTFNAWKAANPDFIYMITGASNGSIGFDCLHSLNYESPAIMMPTALADDASDYPAWHTLGLIQELPFFASTNFQDQIFGNYQNFFDTYRALWNESATFYELTFASTAVVLLSCIENTQTMDPLIIRNCIRNFNQSTIYGDISFNPNGWYVDRPNVCLQKVGRGSYVVTYPDTYPNTSKLLIPSQFKMNQTWYEEQQPPHGISKTNKTLAIVFSILGGIALLAIIALYLVSRKYHLFFFKKVPGQDTWGS